MPLTPKEYKQVEQYISKTVGDSSQRDDVIRFLETYVEEPHILSGSTADLLTHANADSIRSEAKRLLEQKSRKEEATGAGMAEIVSDAETPTYIPIAEEIPAGAYLPLGNVVYQLRIEDGRKKLYESKEQTERFRKQRNP